MFCISFQILVTDQINYACSCVQQKRAMDAEYEAADAYKQIDKLKRKHENEIKTLVQQSHMHNKESSSVKCDEAVEPSATTSEQRWRDEFEPLYEKESEFSKLVAEPSWFSGYDRCNI